MVRQNRLRLPLQPPTIAVPSARTVDEIYDNANELIIQESFEDQRVERKPARIDPRQLGDYFSVYANRAPHGGVIFLGVADGGEIEGCSSLDSKRLDELEKAGNTYCPDARYDSKRVAVYNQKNGQDFIVAFRVAYRHDKLVENTKGEAFTRIGSSKKKLSELEKREIRINKGEIDFETEDVPLAWPGAFDQELVTVFCATFAKRRRLTSPASAEQVLVLAHMGRLVGSSFVPNNACTLMFAKDPRRIFPGARVRVRNPDAPHSLNDPSPLRFIRHS